MKLTARGASVAIVGAVVLGAGLMAAAPASASIVPCPESMGIPPGAHVVCDEYGNVLGNEADFVETQPDRSDWVVPNAPTDLSMDVGRFLVRQAITLYWDPPTTGPVSYYLIEEQDRNGGEWEAVSTSPAIWPSSPVLWRTFSCNFRVRTVNVTSSGVELYSPPSNVAKYRFW